MKNRALTLAGLTLSLASTLAFADERVTAISVSTLAAASSVAAEVSRPMPVYPLSARRDGYHRGRVLIGYDVASDGTVQDVQVLSASPVQVFTRTAVSAVQKWRYLAGKADKRMVEFTFTCD